MGKKIDRTIRVVGNEYYFNDKRACLGYICECMSSLKKEHLEQKRKNNYEGFSHVRVNRGIINKILYVTEGNKSATVIIYCLVSDVIEFDTFVLNGVPFWDSDRIKYKEDNICNTVGEFKEFFKRELWRVFED